MTTELLTEREAWLAERRSGIGASEAASVCGVSPWWTPLETYLDKVGLLPDREPHPRLLWGLRLEGAIAAAYADETGKPITKAPGLVRNPEAPWMLATPDYLAGDRVVEIKKVSGSWVEGFGPSGTDQIPAHYALQVQQQMACTGLHLADLAALIGDDDFRIYTIEFQPAIVARLVEVERDFMDRVHRRDPPLPDFTHPSTLDLLNMIEPQSGKAVTLPEEFTDDAEQYEVLGCEEQAIKKIRGAHKAALLHAMGDAGVAYLSDGRWIERKQVNRKGYEVEATSYFSFSIKTPKVKQ